jgi:hypothetical protein
MRLQVAAQPFQAGVLRLCYTPPVGAYTYQDPTSTRFNANYASQLPGVNLDICETTAVEFRVPWINALDFAAYNAATTGDFPSNFGAFCLYSYLPVTIAAGATAPTYTMWFWLEDVELVSAVPDNCTLLTPQSGGPKAADPRAAETGVGPITQLLGRTATVLSFAGNIPLISSYAQPAAWAARTAQKVAAAFGWSKPMVLLPPARMLNSLNTFQNNCDGHDASFPLSLVCDNHVEALPGFAGSNVDEMALAYVLAQYALVANFTLSFTDVTGTLKYGANVTPAALWYQGSSNWSIPLPARALNAQASVLTTPLFYVGQCFRRWRGCIRFRFRAAKTKFHTGRVLIGFTPRVSLQGALSTTQFLSPSVLNSPLAYKSSIWDLREGNELVFEVPFVSSVANLEFEDSIGDLTMLVMDPLNGPGTVSTSIPFAVEVSACPDFEFSVPAQPAYFPSPIAVGASGQGVWYAQSGFEPYVVDRVSGAAHAVGERILSLKQLLSRAGFVATASVVAGATTTVGIPRWFSNLYTAVYVGSPPTGVTYSPAALIYCSYLSRMYAFARGSTGAHFTPLGNTLVWAGLSGTDGGVDAISGCGISERHTTLHVVFPYYSATTRSPLAANYTGVYNSIANGAWHQFRGGTTASPGAASWSMNAGDDSQLGFFLGSPPLDCPNSSASSTITAALANYTVVPATL